MASGIVIALTSGRLLQTLRYGVPAEDPLTYVMVTAALTGATFVASYLPASRAAAVDPVVVLRGE
jgi:ABC-type lipoprotein release transport system permease subunit